MTVSGTRPATSPRRPGLLVLPALVPVVVVMGAGLAVAGAQSIGLMPLVGTPALNFGAYRAVASDPAVVDGLVVSVAIASASTAIAVTTGFAVAVLVRRSRLGGRLVAGLAAATVPVPHLVGAAAMGLLLADSGLVARLAGADPNTFPPLVGGPWWVAVIAEYAWKESTFVAVVVLGALAADEGQLDEAAACLGARPRQRLRRVTLPLAAPALVATGGISFAYVVGSYEVAWLLGRVYPEPLPVLAYRLFVDMDLTVRPQALAVAVVTVGLAAVALLIAAVLFKRVAVPR